MITIADKNRDYLVFKSKVAAYLKLHKMTYYDVAERTGCYKESTIRAFMADCNSNGRDDSENVARAISTALDIEL